MLGQVTAGVIEVDLDLQPGCWSGPCCCTALERAAPPTAPITKVTAAATNNLARSRRLAARPPTLPHAPRCGPRWVASGIGIAARKLAARSARSSVPGPRASAALCLRPPGRAQRPVPPPGRVHPDRGTRRSWHHLPAERVERPQLLHTNGACLFAEDLPDIGRRKA